MVQALINLETKLEKIQALNMGIDVVCVKQSSLGNKSCTLISPHSYLHVIFNWPIYPEILNISSKTQDIIPKFGVYSFSIISGTCKCLSLPLALQILFLICETIYKLDVMLILQKRKL